ncbi:MAG: hypothetical protein ACT4PV_06645 [Planctomycetaceae bacterium]
MGKTVIVGTTPGKDSTTLLFSGATADEIADRIAVFMTARGYRLESGDKHQAVYGKGSAVAQAFLGAFINRQKHNITVAPEDGKVAVVIARGMVGGFGGLIGVRRVKKEFQTIVEGLQSRLLG